MLESQRQLSTYPAVPHHRLRYVQVQALDTKFKQFFGIFENTIHLAYAELQSMAAQIAEQAIIAEAPQQHLEKLLVQLQQAVAELGQLIHCQDKIQQYAQLETTAHEKLFFDTFLKSLPTEIIQNYKKDYLLNMARIMTLHCSYLLHAITKEGIKKFAEEIALKFKNYRLLNPQERSPSSNQALIDAIFIADGTKNTFSEDGQTVHLISGKTKNSNDLCLLPGSWSSFQVKGLSEIHSKLMNCGNDAFRAKFLSHLQATDKRLNKLKSSLVLLKNELLSHTPAPSAKTLRKSEANLGNADNKPLIHKASREELEDYATLHRLDSAGARGSFREFIQKNYYPQISNLGQIQIDAKNLSLNGINLMKADLSYVDFTGCDFSHATLYQADLSHAVLENTNFNYAMVEKTLFPKKETQNEPLINLAPLLELQRLIQSELAKIKEVRKLKKTKECSVLIALIEKFFTEMVVVHHATQVTAEEKAPLLTCLPLFYQTYLDAGVAILHNSLNSHRDAQQLLIRNFIIDSQVKLKQWGKLGEMDVFSGCVINLDGLNLFQMDFSGLDFSNVQVTVKQLVTMSNIKTIQQLDNQKLEEAVQQKFKIAKNNLQNAIRTIKFSVLGIHAAEMLDSLACSGHMPTLEHISDETLKLCIYLALNSQDINLLPDKHPLSLINLCEIDTETFMERSIVEIKKDLETLLAARNYDVGSDKTAWISYLKITQFYNNIGDTFLAISDVEGAGLADFTQEQAEEMTGLLDELKQRRREHREGKIKLTEADQRYVDNLMKNLLRTSPHAIPEEDTAAYRLERAETVVRTNPALVLDLRHYALQPALTQKLKAGTLQLILSQEQVQQLLTKEQQLARSDAFQAAIKSGDILQVKAWLKAGVAINAKATDGRTPIMDACFHGFVEIARVLLENKADGAIVTQQNISIIDGLCLLQDRTPEQFAIIDLLKQYGMVPNFYSLIAIGDFASVQKAIIVDKEAVNASLRGDSPLHFAANFGQIEITALLLAHNANALLPNERNQLPIDLACWHGHVEIVRLLLRIDCDVNRTNHLKQSLLYHAAKQGFIELANLLIQYGARIDLDSAMLLSRYEDVKPWINQDNSLLHRAITLGAENTALFLIDAGVNICQFNADNQLPLELACEREQAHVVAKLLEKASVNVRAMIAQCKKSPLFIAVSKQHLAIAELLLKAGINPDVIESNLGRTPLHQAVKDQNLLMVQLLVTHGANVGIKDKRGLLPIHWAAESGNKEILIILKQGYLEARTPQNKTVRDLLPKEASPELHALLTMPSQSSLASPEPLPILLAPKRLLFATDFAEACPMMTFELYTYLLTFILTSEGSEDNQQQVHQALPLVSKTWCGFYKQHKSDTQMRANQAQENRSLPEHPINPSPFIHEERPENETLTQAKQASLAELSSIKAVQRAAVEETNDNLLTAGIAQSLGILEETPAPTAKVNTFNFTP